MEEHKNNTEIKYEIIPMVIKNKEKSIKKSRNEYMKEYMANSNNVICSCGGIFKKYSTYIHNKSIRHKKYIEKYPNNTVLYKEMIIKMDTISE